MTSQAEPTDTKVKKLTNLAKRTVTTRSKTKPNPNQNTNHSLEQTLANTIKDSLSECLQSLRTLMLKVGKKNSKKEKMKIERWQTAYEKLLRCYSCWENSEGTMKSQCTLAKVLKTSSVRTPSVDRNRKL